MIFIDLHAPDRLSRRTGMTSAPARGKPAGLFCQDKRKNGGSLTALCHQQDHSRPVPKTGPGHSTVQRPSAARQPQRLKHTQEFAVFDKAVYFDGLLRIHREII